jgi:hypothetical protein
MLQLYENTKTISGKIQIVLLGIALNILQLSN